MGGMMTCSFGAAPSSLVVIRPPILTSNMPAGNIMDHKPMVNILPFGVCSSLANPVVASATAAAMGVLTPMPCIPATMSPWVVGAVTVILDNAPALDDVSKCMCNWGGVISFTQAGQATHQIP
jgi:hypothetical protein